MSDEEQLAQPVETEEQVPGSGDLEAAEVADSQEAAVAAEQSAPTEAAAEEDGARAGDDTAEGPGLGKTVLVEPDDLKGALEALILVADKPVPATRLARLSRSDLEEVKLALEQLREEYADRGIVLDAVAGGYQFRTHPRYAPVVRSLVRQRPVRLTRAQLEVLSIAAYRQPVTRPELEEVRGVDSGSALHVLLDRGVLKIIGKKDEPGRPMLYATTPEFLSLFGLKSLRDLPTLREFTELSDESRDMFERRIGERPPLEGFADDANDAQAIAERESELRAEAADEDDPPETGSGVESESAAEAADTDEAPSDGEPEVDDVGLAQNAQDEDDADEPDDDVDDDDDGDDGDDDDGAGDPDAGPSDEEVKSPPEA